MRTKKINHFVFVSTLFLGLNTSAFADGGFGMLTKKSGFNIGVDALYLRANNPNLSYAIVTSNENHGDLDPFNNTTETVEPTYDWGFRIQAGYWFPCSCYDISLAYLHLNTADSGSVEAPIQNNSAVIVPPFNDSYIYGSNFSAAKSTVEFNLNAVDLDAGRHIFYNNFDVRFLAGLRYANINRDIYTNAVPFSTDFITSADQVLKSYFKGVGPRVGAQGRYGQCRGWGLDADVSLAVLIGQLDSSYCGHILDTVGSPANYYWNNKEIKNCAVPALEAKLGADYTYPIGCKHDAALTFEVGYQATTYFDALNITPSIGDDQTRAAKLDTSTTSNVTFNGLYLGVKYYA